MIRVTNVDPAGNITAIVQSSVEAKHRVSIAQSIMKENPEVEQVAYAVAPIMGGDCRIEMMGGEFCGNATRAFGYLFSTMSDDTLTQHDCSHSGRRAVSVEISGAQAPVQVQVDLQSQSAYTDMPLPSSINYISPVIKRMCISDFNAVTKQMCSSDSNTVTKQMCSSDAGMAFPLVRMEGIAHLILEGIKPNQEIALALLEQLKQEYPEEAYGILFLEKQSLIPLVYVCKTQTLVWESSCGSGTTACAWYLMKKQIFHKEDGNYAFTFQEPGGILNTDVMVKNHQITHIWMGGSVQICGFYEMEFRG